MKWNYYVYDMTFDGIGWSVNDLFPTNISFDSEEEINDNLEDGVVISNYADFGDDKVVIERVSDGMLIGEFRKEVA